MYDSAATLSPEMMATPVRKRVIDNELSAYNELRQCR
jgi:hypothetical protein